MSTFEDRLGAELDRAVDRLIAGRRPARRWVPAVALALAAIVAVVLLAGGRQSERAVAPAATPHISLLDRPATAADRAAWAGISPIDRRSPFLKATPIRNLRLVLHVGSATVMIGRGRNGRVCQYTYSPRSAGGGCAESWPDGTQRDGAPLFEFHNVTAGLFYDGVDRVTAVYRDGHTVDVPVTGNVAVVRHRETKPYPDLVALRWTVNGKPAEVRFDHGQVPLRSTWHRRAGSAFAEYTDKTWYLLLDGVIEAEMDGGVRMWATDPDGAQVALHDRGPSGMPEHEVDYDPPAGAERYTQVVVRRGQAADGKILFRGVIPPAPVDP
jgi:hypothetical protein